MIGRWWRQIFIGRTSSRWWRRRLGGSPTVRWGWRRTAYCPHGRGRWLDFPVWHYTGVVLKHDNNIDEYFNIFNLPSSLVVAWEVESDSWVQVLSWLELVMACFHPLSPDWGVAGASLKDERDHYWSGDSDPASCLAHQVCWRGAGAGLHWASRARRCCALSD